MCRGYAASCAAEVDPPWIGERWFSAADAKSVGLVNRVVPDADVLPGALQATTAPDFLTGGWSSLACLSKLGRARSLLNRSRFLRPNTHFAALIFSRSTRIASLFFLQQHAPAGGGAQRTAPRTLHRSRLKKFREFRQHFW